MSTPLNAPPAQQEPKSPNIVDATPNLPSEVMSFGTFKPVGHVLIGIRGERELAQLAEQLEVRGLANDLVWITPRESADELQSLIDNASGLAGFGYEITLMRRYVELSRSGHLWLLVSAKSDEQAQQVADVAREAGASLAVSYGRFIVEELI